MRAAKGRYPKLSRPAVGPRSASRSRMAAASDDFDPEAAIGLTGVAVGAGLAGAGLDRGMAKLFKEKPVKDIIAEKEAKFNKKY